MIFIDSMNHIFSDESIDELFCFCVKKLNLKPEWNHYSPNFPHFDCISFNVKLKALNNGAQYIKVRSDEWIKILDKVKKINYDNIITYDCKGIKGQKIKRIDFKKMKLLK